MDRKDRKRGGPGLPGTTLAVFTLSSLALGQPLFDLISRNPEFLTAHKVGLLEIIALIAIPCVVIPSALVLLRILCAWMHKGVGDLVGVILIFGLFFVLLAPMIQRVINDSGHIVISISAALALLLLLLWLATRPVRILLDVLAISIPVVPLVFLFSSGVTAVWRADNFSYQNMAFDRTPPIVMVVFDELDLSTLMKMDGSIDERKYPNFARLAGQSTWYRNAAAVSVETAAAIPAMLTGRYPEGDKPPTAGSFPQNLFTLLASNYHIVSREWVTQLCPVEICVANTVERERNFGQLLTDAGLVLMHILLPADYAEALPSISSGWSNFNESSERPKPGSGSVKGNHRAAQWSTFIEKIRKGADTANPFFYYHVPLPHSPYSYLPNGDRYGHERQRGLDSSGRWSRNETVVAQANQRYLLQLAYVDSLLGEMLDTLEAIGLMDSALLVVTADHGVSFRPCDWRRLITSTNLQDLLPIPLFIKAPDQSAPKIDARLAQPTDILPTIAELLGASVPWITHGASLHSRQTANRQRFAVFEDQTKRHSVSNDRLDRAGAVRRRHELFPDYRDRNDFPYIGSPLLHGPPTAELLGGSQITHATIETRTIMTGPGIVLIKGLVDFVGEMESNSLRFALVHNGVVQAITAPYDYVGGTAKFTALVPADFRTTNDDDWQVLSFNHAVFDQIDDSTTRSEYVFSNTRTQRVIKSRDGREYRIDNQKYFGWVDGFSNAGDALTAHGWAGDSETGEVATQVLAFADGNLVAHGPTGKSRLDVAEVFNEPQLSESGFSLRVPQDAPLACLRIFALSKSTATELSINPQGLLSTATDMAGPN